MGTHVIFVRHGQSDANVNKYFAGHTNAPLTAVGISQAEKMAEYLRKYPISAVYASDLSRAYYTAKPIADIFNLPVITDRRLREVNAGEWHAQNFSVLRQNETYMKWLTGRYPIAPKDGESIADLFKRVDSAITEIVSKHKGETIAIVTHATPIRVLKTKWDGVPLSQLTSIDSPPNASVTIVDYKDNGKVDIVLFGENSFLEELSAAATTQL